MAAMTSFHAEKCCHLVRLSAHAASTRRIYSSVCQLCASTSVYSSRSIVHSYLFVQLYATIKNIVVKILTVKLW